MQLSEVDIEPMTSLTINGLQEVKFIHIFKHVWYVQKVSGPLLWKQVKYAE